MFNVFYIYKNPVFKIPWSRIMNHGFLIPSGQFPNHAKLEVPDKSPVSLKFRTFFHPINVYVLYFLSARLFSEAMHLNFKL